MNVGCFFNLLKPQFIHLFKKIKAGKARAFEYLSYNMSYARVLFFSPFTLPVYR